MTARTPEQVRSDIAETKRIYDTASARLTELRQELRDALLHEAEKNGHPWAGKAVRRRKTMCPLGANALTRGCNALSRL